MAVPLSKIRDIQKSLKLALFWEQKISQIFDEHPLTITIVISMKVEAKCVPTTCMYDGNLCKVSTIKLKICLPIICRMKNICGMCPSNGF